MNRLLLLLALSTAASAALSSCSDKSDVLETTVVQGNVVNKYTSQPTAGVPITVRRVVAGGLFNGGASIDSVTAARTDASGHYSLSFEAKKTGTYEVKLANQMEFYDLDHGYDGSVEAQRGKTNLFNFNVTPYVSVTVNANASKGGKTDINFYCVPTTGSVSGADIFYDITPTTQSIVFSRTIKLVPNQRYRFVKSTANRVNLVGSNYELRDEAFEIKERQVLYTDTTVVNFR